MNFQELVDCCSVASAVLSVEKTPEGHCGEIHIVRANKPYRDIMGPAYYDGMLYQELVPQDVKFEDFCFRAAHMNQRMHAYVETKALDCWTDQVMIPLQPQGPEIGYCQFLFEFTKGADASRMANVSVDTAATAIKACITLMGADDFKASVYEVLGDILQAAEAFSSRIMLIDNERHEATMFCERHADDSAIDWSLGDGVLSYEVVSTWEDMIGVSNAVIVKDEREMEKLAQRNPTWVKSMRQYDVHSLVLLPLRRGKTIIGFLYVVNFNVEKAVAIKELIELVSFFLGSEISNYLLMQRLEELSTLDGLTGLSNRNAMSQRMTELDQMGEDRPQFGVVTADLNGLKATNDRAGHEAGDQLIRKASQTLRGVFRRGDLFRMGGDEFVVIASGISQELFEKRVGQLRSALAEQSDVNIAIGSFWSDGSHDAHTAFREADAQMYVDKKAYYDSHPEARR